MLSATRRFLRVSASEEESFVGVAVATISMPTLQRVRTFQGQCRRRCPRSSLAVIYFCITKRRRQCILRPRGVVGSVTATSITIISVVKTSRRFRRVITGNLGTYGNRQVIVKGTLESCVHLNSFSVNTVKGVVGNSNKGGSSKGISKASNASNTRMSNGNRGGSSTNTLAGVRQVQQVTVVVKGILPFKIAQSVGGIFLLVSC